MGVVIPQVVISDRASGAQVIDGSLKFDRGSNTYITRTPSAGDQNTWTWSTWVKRSSYFGSRQAIFGNVTASATTGFACEFDTNNRLDVFNINSSGTYNGRRTSTRRFRDTGWYHIVIVVDTSLSIGDKIKVYVNGDQITDFDTKTNLQAAVTPDFNTTNPLSIGRSGSYNAIYSDNQQSQVYFIDGQALGPEYFGYTDGLTNTWKPKKYEGTFGTNGFWLPMDGNSPIGQDQSGQGNDFTPKNFGGSLELDNPNVSGARPILNTTQGGTQAGVGVFGSKQNVGYAVTVYNSGGGNKYYLDGVEAPTLTGLIRGATYTFDQSDSTNGTHPLVFGTTAEGNNFNGTAVTGASAGSVGAATTITIPYDGPNTIYYHCSVHSGMGADITGITTNEKLADQYASHCVLALPLVGGDDDVSTSIACTSSLKSGTLTTASIVTTNSNFYSGSLNMGSGYYNITDSTDFNFGSGSYTLECWVYVTSGGTAGSAFIGKWYAGSQGTTNSYLLYRNTSGELHWIVSSDGTNGTSYNAGAIPLNKWTHCAASYDSSSDILTTFIDGVCVKRVSSPVSPATVSRTLTLGRWDIGDGTWSGQMSDVRIYKGVAKYTASAEGNQGFVPASTNPDILPDTPSGVSGSSKLTKITDGAVSFDGTGDYLRAASVSWNPNTSNFTIECFIYLDTAANEKFIAGALDWFWFSCSYTGGSSGVTSGKFGFSMRNSANTTWYSVSSTTSFEAGRWYHVAATWDGTYQRMFVNGVQEGISADRSSIDWASKTFHVDIGGYNSNTGFTIDGYISNFRIIDGTALYTKNFTAPPAPLTNVTNTEVLCCQSVGVTTAAAVGIVTAYNDAAATNFNPFITDINTVRGQESGYTTWNPLDIQGLDSGDLKDGNLSITHSAANWLAVRANKFVSSGKWYYEVKVGNNQYTTFGVGSVDYNLVPTSNDWCNVANVYGFYPYNGKVYDAATGRAYATADTSAAGNVYGIAIDMDNKSLRFYENGRDLGVAFDSTTATNFVNKESVAPMAWLYNQSGTDEYNFGQKPFKFPPPDGFQPLNAANTRPDNVILRPDQYVGIVTYASDGNARTISGLNFQPDLVWQKQTTSGDSDRHFLTDSVRGAGTALRSDTDAADASCDAVSSFTSDGWTIGSGSGNANQNAKSYVAWAWKAGGSGGGQSFWKDDVGYASAAAAGITGLDGTNQMTTAKYLGCSIGTKQGFSIIKYNGLGGSNDVAIPHGLSQSPDLVIVKNLTDVISWAVAHSGFPDNRELHLDTDESSTSVAFLGLYKSNFTSTSFAVNYGASNLNYVNASGKDYIAYVWHNVAGLQKFGSYKGNQNADGVYVELGFRPKLVWIKSVTVGGSGYSWYIHDSERSKFNPTTLDLKADVNANNVATTRFDFLSNGFKIRGANLDMNDSGETFIYCAWAEAPSVDLFGGGANAR